MDLIQGMGYVQAVGDIDPRSMSKEMFRFVRAAARAAARGWPDRDDVERFVFRPAETPGMTPAQDRLMKKHIQEDWLYQPDAWGP